MSELLGLLTAAGRGERVAPLPCSKEIFPVGFESREGRPVTRLACQALLEGFAAAGVTNVLVVLGHGKWDIPARLGSGAEFGLAIAYTVIRDSRSSPHSLMEAYHFARGRRIAFGFPDIMFEPHDAFARLLAKQEECEAQIVLGLFPAERPQSADMVEFGSDGQVRRILVKSPDCGLRYAWIIAVWTPDFTEFAREYLGADGALPAERELFIGHLFQAALETGLRIVAVPFPQGRFVDIGTPDALLRAVQMHTPPLV